MNSFKIYKGLDLPLAGKPLQSIQDSPQVKTVAVVGPDYVGMKPTMAVQEGDRVKLGQVLFTDKKTPGVKYTSPAGGTVKAINRGDKRALLSVVIEIDPKEEEKIQFPVTPLDKLTADDVVKTLVDSGQWTALRTRPFSKVPSPETRPNAIFVTAMDSNPHAPCPAVALKDREDDFLAGLKVLSVLAGDKPLFFCQSPDCRVLPEEAEGLPNLQVAEFSGKHPCGLVGTHIHFLCPASRTNVVWHVNYQDVAAFGYLFKTGYVCKARVISLSGPIVKKPRLIKTRIGANLDELTNGEFDVDAKNDIPARVISGSVLNGRKSEPGLNYLGRYSLQVSVLREGVKRRLFGWILPKFVDFSTKWTNASLFFPNWEYNMTTDVYGGPRAIFSIGSMDDVMPLDILPVFLTRALAVGNLEQSEQLGALELDEEDLALCTYVDPGKNEFGSMLRSVLTLIDKEG
jgi:Na+-transporting NADH:ubiquinone oxidoreductase subunit A